MTVTVEAGAIVRRVPVGTAWARAAGVSALLAVVVGFVGFGIGAQSVAARLGTGVFAAFVLDLIFLGGILVVIAAVVLWQRAHGETIRDLGWRAPTRASAVVLAVVYGAAWTAFGYLRGGNPLGVSWERPVMALIGIVLAFGEELAVRGFLMEQLRRGGVPAWAQVVVGAVVMGAYHGIIGFHYSPIYAATSAVLFAIVSLLFLLGRRSLTPGLISHAMTHVLGDPVLLQGILKGVVALG